MAAARLRQIILAQARRQGRCDVSRRPVVLVVDSFFELSALSRGGLVADRRFVNSSVYVRPRGYVRPPRPRSCGGAILLGPPALPKHENVSLHHSKYGGDGVMQI